MEPIDQFLAIESDIKLFDYKVIDKSLHLWPLIRFRVISSALYESVGISDPYVPFRINYTRLIPYFFKTLRYRSSLAQKSNLLFFGSDVSNIITESGFFNRLSELFASQYESETSIFEESINFNYKRPRTFKKVYTYDNITLLSKLFSKFILLSKDDLLTINGFVDFLSSNFPFKFHDEEFWNKLKKVLIRLCREYYIKHYFFRRLLIKTKPKVIFVEAASYGGSYITLILAAKALGIKTIEYQHGLISFNHPAYNFHSGLQPEYLKYLPDYFLAYGEYWKTNCRLPVEIVVIGNPFLSESAGKLNCLNKKNQLLYASGAVEYSTCLKNVLYLKEHLAAIGFSILFRPHPSEIHLLDSIYKPFKEAGILNDQKNLYETLTESKFVFGVFSTVLFEALAFGCIPIVLKNSGSEMHLNYPEIVLQDNVEGAFAYIKENKEKFYDTRKLWEPNWKSNFKKFMAEKCNYNSENFC
jgi:hypothetical protein